MVLQVSRLWNNFPSSSDVGRAQTALLTSWNMYDSSRDKDSTPGSNHEILPAAAFSWELNEPRISASFLLLFRNIRTSSLWLDASFLRTFFAKMRHIPNTTNSHLKDLEFHFGFLQHARCVMALLFCRKSSTKNYCDKAPDLLLYA